MAKLAASTGAHLDEVYALLPFEPVSGHGVYLRDAGGREVLDFYGGHAEMASDAGECKITTGANRRSFKPFREHPRSSFVFDQDRSLKKENIGACWG